MSLHRYAKARDANEPGIVAALEAMGATVLRLDTPVDLLVGYQGENLLLEVKLPLGPRGGRSRSYLTPDQTKFFAHWRGKVFLVRNAEEAVWIVEHGRLPNPPECEPPHSRDCRCAEDAAALFETIKKGFEGG